MGRANISHNLEYKLSGVKGADSLTSINGEVLLGGNVADVSLRGSFDYTIEPMAHGTQVNLTAQRQFSNLMTARASVSRALIGDWRHWS